MQRGATASPAIINRSMWRHDNSRTPDDAMQQLRRNCIRRRETALARVVKQEQRDGPAFGQAAYLRDVLPRVGMFRIRGTMLMLGCCREV